MLAKARADGVYQRLDAIGIGVPGPVSFRDGLPVSPPIMPSWDRYPVREVLTREYGCPAVVDNDVNIMAIGERYGGVAHSVDDYLFVKIGTGVGCGIYLHGEVYRGTDGCAGDIGHIQVDGHGPVCPCGNVGCLEAVFSASYTDLGGPGGVPPLTTIDQVSIRQRHQEVEYRLEESSTNVQTTDDVGGGQHLSSLNDGSWSALRGSYQLVDIDSLTFRIADATAELTATGGTGDWQSQTFPLTDPGGVHDLYLVFRTVPGGPTGNSTFLLNWVEFGGPGVTQ